MIELRLLGGLDLAGPHREQSRVILAQPRRAALLAFLALTAPDGLQRRDRIVRLFWPDADPSAGRQSLRQALAFLRKALGEEPFISNDQVRGEEQVGLDPALLRCDVHQLRQLIAAGELARAAELYRGDFLEGLPDTGLQPFEQWREETADELRAQMRTTLRDLSMQAASAGHTDLAAHWARRELALNPVDEQTVMHTLQALAAAGATTEALETYDSFVRVLTQEFDEEPSGALRSLADRLRNPPEHRPPTVAVAARPAPPQVPAAPQTRPPPRRWVVGGTLAAGIILLVVIALLKSASPGVARAGSDDVANPVLFVQPFRVSGADASLAYLREGMPELLGTRVEGEVGWSSRTTQQSQANHVLTGTVVGTPARVSIEVSLRRAGDNDILLTTSVNGPADSIPLLADRIAALLLFERAGYHPAEPEALLRKPLPLLREFLAGQLALRQGRYGEALRTFEKVLAADANFVQAALGLGAAGRQIGEWTPWQVGLRAAWAQRHTLGKADSLYLVALAGPRFPQASTHAQVLDAWERVNEHLPEFAIGWYELGSHLLSWGPVMGIPNSAVRARAALTRALEIDPARVEPVVGLIEIAADAGDTTAVRTLHDRYVRTGLIGDSKHYLNWRVAHVFGQKAALAEARRALDTIPYLGLRQIIGWAQVHGVGMRDAAHAVALVHSRGGRRSDDPTNMLTYWALNRGNADEAVRLQLGNEPVSSGALRIAVITALYAGGDTVAGARAARELTARSRVTMTPETPRPQMVTRSHDVCALVQWQLWHGEPVNVQPVVNGLRSMQRTETTSCATLIAAIDGVLNKRPNARALLDSLDIEQRVGELLSNEYYGNIAAARLWERLGDFPRALAAARRRPHNHWAGPAFLRSFLETEQRMAERTGDQPAAAAAARHLQLLSGKT